MKPASFVRIFLLLLFAAGCQSTELSRVVVYYVPFEFESTEVVTPENLKDKANSIEFTDKKAIVSLVKLLATGREGPGFDRKRVRLLIIMAPGDRSVWVDAQGNLLEGNQQRRLDPERFDQLQALVSTAVATGGEMK